MAYSKQTKELILNLLSSGYCAVEISKEYGINGATLSRWKKELKKEDAPTIQNLKAQISQLSKGKSSDSKAKQIAMLSASLSRLEGIKAKERKVKNKKKPLILMNADYESLKQKALSEGGLYGYQKDFINDTSQFRIVLKSRQIGFSYASSLDALLGAVAGRNQLFLSASEEQARILMNYLDGWAAKFNIAFAKNSEYEKSLDNGAVIRAMPHNFRTVQGFTGDIWMDEFAWYPNQKRIWHAFVPSIGAVAGRLTILSTPFEENSLFHELFDNETKYYMFSRHRVDIYRAIEDGLNFDLETMRDLFDADTWASAYECQFIDDENALLSVELIKSCIKDYAPALPAKSVPQYAGFDVGRTKDRSAHIAVFDENGVKKLSVLDVIAKASFEAQENLLIDFLRLNPLAMQKIDKTGIGMSVAEKVKRRFPSRVQGVYFTQSSKEAMALNLKKHFEDKSIIIPNDPALIADLHAVKRKAGAKSFTYDSDRNEHGHADRFWALALALSYFEKVRDKRGKAYIIG
ncbi:transposase [Campylobacter sp. RM6883]|uniref:terminase large subunit domain-containing protein n=1 Tax=Campylobacter californiensis TaxID=1032243 RepID=UPI0014512813|nr:terminase family protein [Campylobacter sp. RM6914]MBE2984657.1 transposase [Campylobacter sp. RM6883]MBE2994573.1 transposase [Campylobacter sp. RM6913]QCD50384.1 terminase domain protein [Campylobacter sp. RM6914]